MCTLFVSASLLSDCQVVMTISCHTHLTTMASFPDWWKHSLLSKIRTTKPLMQLPMSIWLGSSQQEEEKESCIHTLALVLSAIPAKTVAELDAIDEAFKPLVFNLAVLHITAIYSSQNQPNTYLFQPHFCDLLVCLSSLLMLNASTKNLSLLLDSLSTYVREIYNKYNVRQLQELAPMYLNQASISPNYILSIPVSKDGSVDIVTPSANVSVSSYGQHAIGLLTESSSSSTSHSTATSLAVGSSSELREALLCTLGSVPEAGVIMAATPTQQRSRGSRDRRRSSSMVSALDSKLTREVLDMCMEELPDLIPPLTDEQSVDIDGHVCEGGFSKLAICSELPSSDVFQRFAHERVISTV